MNVYFLYVSCLIYGCMGLGGGWNDKLVIKVDIS